MKNIIIIGAQSAIASACARLWAAQGATFFLVGRNPAKLANLADDLMVRGAAAAHAHPLDVNDQAAHAAMLAAACAALGRVDGLLVAHGTLPDQTACAADPALTHREFLTNGLSVIDLLTLFANHFEQQGHGRIGVISSVAGDRGRPSNYVYGSAKAAVSVFCEGLRARLFRAGVSVTDIRPGFIATPMTAGLPLPSALVAQPDAVAERIVAAIDKKRDVVYVPTFWAAIMLVIRTLPRFVFKRLKL